ncbi:MarR family winged helix-turn-helix transcriptional regulator [Segnochrobactrum spirostomi]|uniref:MarR family transcriptional regulator n=1 Tax=Segnochrobactrum spirostomi TaxID=2608987 RepID=A0A6A7Y102_9HYPH|nr:MarR family transcriptional regulator [Segnochrobactrum spirostomi]MQT11609.1 MarR family transcriptional regulator [Segnochrobactrum spirostomi]
MDQPPPPDAAQAAALAAEIRALLGKLRRRLRDQADIGDLTPSQVSALLRLEREGPATASSLARAEGMRPQSMGTVIAALEAAGLVQGQPDPTDGRRILLSLTDSCREWIRRGRAARQDWLSNSLQTRLSAEDLNVVGRAVTLLARLTDG